MISFKKLSLILTLAGLSLAWGEDAFARRSHRDRDTRSGMKQKRRAVKQPSAPLQWSRTDNGDGITRFQNIISRPTASKFKGKTTVFTHEETKTVFVLTPLAAVTLARLQQGLTPPEGSICFHNTRLVKSTQSSTKAKSTRRSKKVTHRSSRRSKKATSRSSRRSKILSRRSKKATSRSSRRSKVLSHRSKHKSRSSRRRHRRH